MTSFFHRWDYTGISHIYLRELMVMNPDGTGQLVLVDPDQGGYEANGLVKRISGRGDPINPVVRGGSFFGRPARCRSAFRLAYPPWQRVFNVGFRILGDDQDGGSNL